MRITITGSEGLIGRPLIAALEASGHTVRRLDLRMPPGDECHGDILDAAAVQRASEGSDGIVHLAAVSRVAWGEEDPPRCERVNVDGTVNVIEAARRAASKPWLLFASSREVYGDAGLEPVREDAPTNPVNVYGRTKAEAERRVMAARADGLRVAALRLTNVYGRADDHKERVIPAFTRASAEGRDLRIDGESRTFDFTHVSDVVSGFVATIDRLAAGVQLPVVHLPSGRGTSLGDLARLAVAAGGGRSKLTVAPKAAHDVANFIGDPSLALRMFGWRATTSVDDGVPDMVRQFQRLIAATR